MAQGDIGIYASQVSGRLWAPNGAMDALATVTVGTNAPTEVIFTGIPQGYKHLQIRAVVKHNAAGSGTDNGTLQFNGDTAANYSGHFLYGSGSGAGNSSGYANLSNMNVAFWMQASSPSYVFGAAIIDILDYSSNTKNTTVRSFSGVDTNGAGIASVSSGAWYSTAPVTSIRLYGATFSQYTQFALYGVK